MERSLPQGRQRALRIDILRLVDGRALTARAPGPTRNNPKTILHHQVLYVSLPTALLYFIKLSNFAGAVAVLVLFCVGCVDCVIQFGRLNGAIWRAVVAVSTIK